MKCIDLLANKESTLIKAETLQDSLAMLYHENSKLDSVSGRTLGIEISGFLQNPYTVERSNLPFKCYPDKPLIDLSIYKDVSPPQLDFTNLLKNRKSQRTFDKNYIISDLELFIILHYSYGVLEKEALNFDAFLHRRSVPSGGGLYPLEIYVVLFKGDSNAGLYHFRPNTAQLETLKEGQFSEDIAPFIGTNPHVNIKDLSCVIITTAIFQRTMMKYKDRGYRFIFNEVGAVGQTMSLLATGLELGSCFMGGYMDDAVNDFLGIDGYNESVVNVMCLGKNSTE